MIPIRFIWKQAMTSIPVVLVLILFTPVKAMIQSIPVATMILFILMTVQIQMMSIRFSLVPGMTSFMAVMALILLMAAAKIRILKVFMILRIW